MRLLLPHKFDSRMVVAYRCDRCDKIFPSAKPAFAGYDVGVPWHVEHDFAKHICDSKAASHVKHPVAFTGYGRFREVH